MTTQRVATITGGASGIGFAFAQDWVAQGGRAVLLDLNPEGIDSAVRSLGGPGSARGIVTDVTSNDSVVAAFASVAAEEGRLDVAVNCAGISRPAPSAELDDAAWSLLVEIHLSGTMRACRAAYPLLKETGRGSIVNISSVASRAGMPGRASYCASKAGIDGLTRVLAVEWAADGIRVNSVAPGYVLTALTEVNIANGHVDPAPIIARTPLRRFAEPSEISSVISFLASDAASYVTGHSLTVDGGMTIDGNWY